MSQNKGAMIAQTENIVTASFFRASSDLCTLNYYDQDCLFDMENVSYIITDSAFHFLKTQVYFCRNKFMLRRSYLGR